MLGQESEGVGHGKSPHRTRSKFNISKVGKPKAMKPIAQGQAFNDPLYEYLDHEVHNKEQHNFGPWVEHERMKSRERNHRMQRQLPVLYRPQDTTTRYYQEMISENSQNLQNVGPSLPNIRERNLRAYSLQNLRAASLEFNPADNMPLRRRETSLKTPFFLKMHGYPFPKSQDLLQNSKKCNVIYNYCYQQDPTKDLPPKKGLLTKGNENYLKLTSKKTTLLGQASTNQLLLRELKQHRLNKFK